MANNKVQWARGGGELTPARDRDVQVAGRRHAGGLTWLLGIFVVLEQYLNHKVDATTLLHENYSLPIVHFGRQRLKNISTASS